MRSLLSAWSRFICKGVYCARSEELDFSSMKMLEETDERSDNCLLGGLVKSTRIICTIFLFSYMYLVGSLFLVTIVTTFQRFC